MNKSVWMYRFGIRLNQYETMDVQRGKRCNGEQNGNYCASEPAAGYPQQTVGAGVDRGTQSGVGMRNVTGIIVIIPLLRRRFFCRTFGDIKRPICFGCLTPDAAKLRVGGRKYFPGAAARRPPVAGRHRSPDSTNDR